MFLCSNSAISSEMLATAGFVRCLQCNLGQSKLKHIFSTQQHCQLSYGTLVGIRTCNRNQQTQHQQEWQMQSIGVTQNFLQFVKLANPFNQRENDYSPLSIVKSVDVQLAVTSRCLHLLISIGVAIKIYNLYVCAVLLQKLHICRISDQICPYLSSDSK